MRNDNERHAAGTVLMLEGGGMRASYTAAMVSLLLENRVTFDYVCGISAGSSHAVNFLSGDIWRTRASFIDLVTEKEFGGVKTFLEGKGMFSAHWIYEESGIARRRAPVRFRGVLGQSDPACHSGIRSRHRGDGGVASGRHADA